MTYLIKDGTWVFTTEKGPGPSLGASEGLGVVIHIKIHFLMGRGVFVEWPRNLSAKDKIIFLGKYVLGFVYLSC